MKIIEGEYQLYVKLLAIKRSRGKPHFIANSTTGIKALGLGADVGTVDPQAMAHEIRTIHTKAKMLSLICS